MEKVTMDNHYEIQSVKVKHNWTVNGISITNMDPRGSTGSKLIRHEIDLGCSMRPTDIENPRQEVA